MAVRAARRAVGALPRAVCRVRQHGGRAADRSGGVRHGLSRDAFLAGGESITTEFKECRNKLPKNLFETICAFLNRMGGDIFLGVADGGTITGVDESCVPQLKKNISSLCNNANKIAPTVYLHTDDCEIEGKTVLHIYVPESSQVHSTAGKIYDRNEDGDFDITGNSHLVAQMYIRKQREFTENTIYPYATLNDLETETIREVRIMAVNRQPNHPWEKLTDEELLKSCGLYKRDLQTGASGYTLACILLFGKDEAILSAIPYFKTDAVYRKENLDRYDDRDEIKCNLIKSYGRLMAFIEKHLDDKFYMDGDRRIDVRNSCFGGRGEFADPQRIFQRISRKAYYHGRSCNDGKREQCPQLWRYKSG